MKRKRKDEVKRDDNRSETTILTFDQQKGISLHSCVWF